VNAALADDLRGVGAAVLASVVLLASPMPALAKGGGHGGGGHSSSHSSSYHSSSSSSSSSSRRSLHPYHGSARSVSRRRSSSRSSSRRSSGVSSSRSYSYSSAGASPPPPIVLYPDESAARKQDGYFCPANLPSPGERVDIAGDAGLPQRTATVISSQRPSQSSLYGAGGGRTLQPVPGFESDCSVTVKYDDGTTGTVSAAELPTPLIEQAAPFLAYAGLQGAIAVLDSDGGDSWSDAEERHEDSLLALKRAWASGDTAQDAPPSGEWWGSSEESDEGDQAARSTLKFHPDGTVTGRGEDGVDGAYQLSRGRWGVLDGDTRPTVAWIEKYDEGFQVAVKGRYNPRNGKIQARFASSRGVSGAFELAPKPSVF